MGGEEPATYVTSYLSYGWVAERKRRAKIVNGMEQKPQGYWMYYPYYYADPIPSFSFCSGRKNTSHPCKIETGFLCGDSARVIRFFAGVIQQLGLWTQKTSGAAPRALRSALDSTIQAYAQTLVWPRRDVPRRFTWHFFSTKHPSPAR